MAEEPVMRYFKNNSGVSIIATVLVMLMLAVFGAVIVSLVTTGSQVGVQEEQGVQAFDIAEGGLQKALNYIIKQKDADCTTLETCACTDAAAYVNTNPSLGAGSFNVTTTPTHVTNPATLNGNINATQTSIPVNSNPQGVYALSGRIMIDREVIEYTSLTANSFEGCKRGVAGTLAANHSSGTRVGQKQCLIISTGTISTNPLASVQRQVSTVTEIQNGWSVGGGGEENLNEVHCTASDKCSAVGDTGTIMQWDGSAWRRMTSPTGQDLNSVFMISTTNGWAVGREDGDELILRWDGATWSRLAPSPSIPDENLNSVFCTASDNCWAVGNDVGGGTDSLIINWNGTQWTYVDPAGNIDLDLNSVYMVSSTNGWAVGERVNATRTGWTFLRWNGANWSSFAVDTGAGTSAQNLNAVFCTNSNSCWAAGNNGRILRWNGANWSLYTPSPTGEDIQSVYILPTGNDGWAVGTNGTILRWNGANWSNVASPTTEDLNSVYMVSTNDGWAVGNAGTILRWDGTSWSLWGGGRMLRWNGASWTDETNTLPAGINQMLSSVSMLSYADGWVVGNRRNNTTTGWTLLRWNPTANTWTLYSSISPATRAQNLRSVFMTSAADGWAVGNRTGAVTDRWMFLRWNNPTANTWNRYTITTAGIIAQNLNSVFMLDNNNDGIADDGWAVGNRTAAANNGWVLFRWNNPTANTWNLYNTVNPATVAENLRSVYCVSSRECWAVGNNGIILNWNGSQWNIAISPSTSNLNSVYVIGTSTPLGQWKENYP